MNNHSLKIDLFCCSSSFDPEELAQSCGKNGEGLKVIPLPCSGKVDILYLTKAFETGADGVAVVTCKRATAIILRAICGPVKGWKLSMRCSMK